MYNNIIQAPSFYRVGLYIRLSESDEDKTYESESESIINQRNLLMDYVKGRDYIQCGYYVEQYFPQKKIRYISILDQVDTFLESANNDIAPFKALFNDMTSKDTSKKIRSILKNKKEQGKFIGSKPCYGYMRDPLDKGHLIPNLETASIVKKIFKWRTEGIGPTEIATRLNDMNVPTPAGYKKTNYSSRLIDRDSWNISTVKKILSNRIYTGDMVQHTQTKVNYKSKKKITLDESLWVIVEDTHEPLVDKETFKYVNSLGKRKTRNYGLKTERPKRILEGKIFCKECGNRLSVYYRKKLDYWSINCNRYSRDPKRGRCSSHFYPYDYLEEQILEQFNNSVSKFIKDLDIEELNKEVQKNVHKETEDIDKKINDFSKEKEQIMNKLSTLYSDRCNNIISAELYKELSTESETKLKKINNIIEVEKIKKQNIKNKANILPDYTKKIKELLDLKKTKKELINSLINKIIIDENRNITIIFKYDVIQEINFTYENRNLVRNPYGKRGKNRI